MANIKLNNNEYQIPDSTLAATTADFIAHLATIAGEGLRVVVGGVEYNVDPSKVAGAIAELGALLEGLNVGGDEALVAGLYQTGAIALYEEQGAKAVEGMMITSWDDLLAEGVVHVDNGSVYTNLDTNTWVNNSADILVGDLVLPNDGSITTLSESAFESCINLTVVDIPNSVTSIGDGAFYGCTGLTSITIPNSVTSIGMAAFYKCSSLTSITIPDSITCIGESTFYKCSSLTSITIPDSITCIGESTFYKCSSLTSIIIPNSITHIGGQAFYGCGALTSITLPDTLTTLGNDAFCNCTGLTNITIPENVTSIGDGAFCNCTGLTNITIPENVTSIGEGAFEACISLTSITFEGTVAQWDAIEKGDCWDNYVPASYIQCSDGKYSPAS